jgi:hypothetical protein
VGFLVATVEGGNFRLALADGGELAVQSTSGGGGGSVTATLPLATTFGGTNVVVSGIAGTTHAVVVSEGSGSAFAFIGPAAAGLPLVAQGVSADPTFAALTVPGGGTGQTTLTAHGVLIGEGASAIAATSPGTAGQVLTSNGAGADPSFQTSNPAPSTWTDVAAAATQAVAAQNAAQFFNVDTTSGAASTFNFPAHGTAIDGQEVTIFLNGASVSTGVNLAPGTSNTMGDPNQAGTFGGAGVTLTAQTPGQVIRRKYKDLGASGAWRPFS